MTQPSPARLLVVRHGRTAWNLERRAQGHTDVGLDETGHRQAADLATVLVEQSPVTLASSDLRRAHETALVLAARTGLEVRTDARLREYDLGVRTGLTLEEFREHVGDDVESGAHVVVEGAETPEQVAQRFVPALREALDALEDGQTGVVVTHGSALRVGLAGLLGLPLAGAEVLRPLPNCHWAEVVRRATGEPALAAYGLGP